MRAARAKLFHAQPSLRRGRVGAVPAAALGDGDGVELGHGGRDVDDSERRAGESDGTLNRRVRAPGTRPSRDARRAGTTGEDESDAMEAEVGG